MWETEGIAARMVESLKAAQRPVPKYLIALAGREAATKVKRVAIAQHCFWTGELKIGALDGVLATEAGWLGGREVTLVEFDEAVISEKNLIDAAKKADCADKVFQDLKGYKTARASDQKKQLSGTVFAKLEMTPMQATKINTLARSHPQSALEWLSPRQRMFLEKPD